MAINDSAVVPLYQQVKDDIRAAIESGKYKTNEKIPPEPELSAEYSVCLLYTSPSPRDRG